MASWKVTTCLDQIDRSTYLQFTFEVCQSLEQRLAPNKMCLRDVLRSLYFFFLAKILAANETCSTRKVFNLLFNGKNGFKTENCE